MSEKTPGQNLTFWKNVLKDPDHPMRKKIQLGGDKETNSYCQKMINAIELDIEKEI